MNATTTTAAPAAAGSRRNRHLLRALLVLAAALTAVLGISTPSQAISQIDDQARYGDGSVFSVDYQGTRTVTVAAWIVDRPGDAYCTSAAVEIKDASWNIIGQRVTLGSVCGGRTGFVERTITVTRDLAIVYNVIGSNGSNCLRASDGHFCQ